MGFPATALLSVIPSYTSDPKHTVKTPGYLCQYIYISSYSTSSDWKENYYSSEKKKTKKKNKLVKAF